MVPILAPPRLLILILTSSLQPLSHSTICKILPGLPNLTIGLIADDL